MTRFPLRSGTSICCMGRKLPMPCASRYSLSWSSRLYVTRKTYHFSSVREGSGGTVVGKRLYSGDTGFRFSGGIRHFISSDNGQRRCPVLQRLFPVSGRLFETRGKDTDYSEYSQQLFIVFYTAQSAFCIPNRSPSGRRLLHMALYLLPCRFPEMADFIHFACCSG